MVELAERADEAQRAKASGDLAAAADRFSQALALFRGEPLAGLPGSFAQVEQVERRRLAERQRKLQLERLECLVLLDRSGGALDELGVDPGKELHRVHEAVLRRDDAYLLGREQFQLALGVPGAAAHPAERAQAVAGLDECEVS